MALKWMEMARPIICLAPMDGITDSAYRRLVRGFRGDVILFSEFTNVDGFLRSEKVRNRLDFHPGEHPYFVQLFGSNPQSFAEVSRALAGRGVAGIDINMGCPAKKIVASQHGSRLMKDVNLACRIVEAVARSSGLEVSVKTRLGWGDSRGLPAFGRALADAGASLITVHGRTYEQGFGGKADWEPIHQLKRELPVRVLGNGDVTDVEEGMKRLGQLDGFMIGRAAIGNPWVFLPEAERRRPPLAERVGVIREHYRLMRQTMPAQRALPAFRKHLAGYLKGLANIKPIRAALMTEPDEGRFFGLLDDLAQRAEMAGQHG